MRRSRIAALLTVLLAAACERPVLSRRPPGAEFLLAAGDSTYWIRSSNDGVRVRSAPILLTETDGRFYEIYITDEVHDFEDASFASARAYRRDILERDSVLVFEDRTVSLEAREWIARHPRAVPLDPDDDVPGDAPPTLVSNDIEIVDVHGPWVTLGHSLDVDVAGRAGHRHTRRHGIVDVRNGARGSLDSLFGVGESMRLQQAGVTAFERMRDSVRISSDERSFAARRTLASFTFDGTSFSITDIARSPAVSFVVPGTGEEGEALSLFVPPISAAEPVWWKSVAQSIPAWNQDSTELAWSRTRYDIIARPTPDGDFLTIELQSKGERDASRAWPIAVVPAPAYQLIALDETPLDSSMRSALARAFDESMILNGGAQQASAPSHIDRMSSRLVPVRARSRQGANAVMRIRAVTRSISRDSIHVGKSCCIKPRRVCGDARSKLSSLHRVPVRTDSGNSDSGDCRRVASL
ncbi:MAG: hypothetical protein ACO1Q7_08300 [Gemmatimonas sp.]